MKKNKQLIIGIVLLIVCVGGYFGVKAFNANQEKKEEAKTINLTQLQVSDITSFSFINEGETLSFEKEGENWIYSGDASIDINETSIEGMLETACNLTSTKKITPENLSEFGFDEPTNVITLNTASGTTVLKIGMFNEILSEYYICVDDSADIYLIASDVVTGFEQTVDNLTVVESTTEEEATEESTEATEDTTAATEESTTETIE